MDEFLAVLEQGLEDALGEEVGEVGHGMHFTRTSAPVLWDIFGRNIEINATKRPESSVRIPLP